MKTATFARPSAASLTYCLNCLIPRAPRRLLCALPLLGLSALLAGCEGGDGSGSGGGGAGGSGGSGGGTTTSTPAITECPLGAESHVVSVIEGPDGALLGAQAATITGTVSAAGLEAPPSAACGGGQAWLKITADEDGSEWLGCFQSPNLYWDFAPGDTADLTQTVSEHPIAPATIHTTLRKAGALVVHQEWAIYEDEIALPEGATLTRTDKVCESPADPCKREGYAVTASAGGESVSILPGESGNAGGLRIYIDHYYTASPSSGCDGGDSDILLSISPVME